MRPNFEWSRLTRLNIASLISRAVGQMNLLLCVGVLTICKLDCSLDRENNNVRLRANVLDNARDGLPILKANARLHVTEMASALEAFC